MSNYEYEGEYKCYIYNLNSINISRVDDKKYKWTSSNGISFLLFITDTPLILQVDEKSPYYSHGFLYCQFEIHELSNTVIRLIGPWKDPYEKTFLKDISKDGIEYSGIFSETPLKSSSITSPKNEITLKKLNNGVLYWRHSNGMEWSLIPSRKVNEFYVGPECPFFIQGFMRCVMEIENNKVQKFQGPENIFYVRQQVLDESIKKSININNISLTSSIANKQRVNLKTYEGFYERKPHENEIMFEEENIDWNFATIKLEEDGILYWNNRAGRSWKLVRIKDNNEKFAIEEDCPIFEEGFKFCEFEFNQKNDKVVKVKMYFDKIFDKIEDDEEEKKDNCQIF